MSNGWMTRSRGWRAVVAGLAMVVWLVIAGGAAAAEPVKLVQPFQVSLDFSREASDGQGLASAGGRVHFAGRDRAQVG